MFYFLLSNFYYCGDGDVNFSMFFVQDSENGHQSEDIVVSKFINGNRLVLLCYYYCSLSRIVKDLIINSMQKVNI